MQHPRYKAGFTLVELLVALAVTSIVLTAVAALAFAVGAANDATDDTIQKQAGVRSTTLRILELVRHCKLVCGTPGNDLAIWRADDNGDGGININELVYIERGANADYLRLCEFPSSDASPVTLSEIETVLPTDYDVTYVRLIPQCSNVEFLFDASPPRTKLLSISFDLTENDVARQYQINAVLLGWAGNLLNEDEDGSVEIVPDDD